MQINLKSPPVLGSLPVPLHPLAEIASNMWWSWHPEAQVLFLSIDPDAWRETNGNPIRVLGGAAEGTLAERAGDAAFVEQVGRHVADLRGYLARRGVNGTPQSIEVARSPVLPISCV